MQSSCQHLIDLVKQIPESLHVTVFDSIISILNGDILANSAPSHMTTTPGESEVARLKQEVRMLHHEKKRLIKKIQELNLERDSAQIKVNNFQRNLKEDFHSLMEKAQQDNATLSELLEVSRKENEVLKSSGEELHRKMLEYLDNLKAMEWGYDSLKNENQELHRREQEWLKTIDDLSLNNQKLLRERDADRKIVSELKEQLSDFDHILLSYKNDNTNLSNKISQLKLLNDYLSSQNQTMTSQNSKLRVTNEELSRKHLELAEEARAATQKLAQVQKDREYEKNQLEKERDSVMKLLESFAAENEKMQETYSSESSKLKELESVKVDLEIEIQELSSVNQNLEAIIEEMKMKTKQLELKLSVQESGYELISMN